MSNLKPLTLKADDFTQLRQGPLRMYFPVDPDTTRRLDDVIKGNQRVPWLRRIIRRVKERFNAVGT